MTTALGTVGEGRDNETYKAELITESGNTVTGYVKLSDRSYQLVSELAAAQLGRALGLPVPTPYLTIVDTALLEERFETGFAGHGLMYAFASRQAGNESYSLERLLNREVANAVSYLQDLEGGFDYSGAAAFDELIANDDRNLGNIVFTPANRRAWLIDHGRALTGELWPLFGLDDPTVSVTNHLADDAAKGWSEPGRREMEHRTQELCRDCAKVSLEELDRDGHYQRIDSAIDAADIIAFLRQRTFRTVELICSRLQLDQLHLPPPQTP
ncbi:HipA family kinase [Halomonas borealis]|uniref:HipA family kinase n=1 Tax=Halomonas borealis TaxID=2508710 RepID=UPI00109F3112|nr:HipA family kinase [Halomonas borealis]